MKLRLRLASFLGNDLMQDLLRLIGGTIGGRLIALAAMPAVTRLYSPSDFALLAVYLGLVSLFGVIASLRFDVAIPVAQGDLDAAHLLVLALLIAASMASAWGFAAYFASERIANLLGQPKLVPWLWLVPFGVLMAGSYSALQFWATRTRRFGSIAMTRITQASVGVATMLGLGLAGVAPLGLLVGNMLSNGSGSLRLSLEALQKDRALISKITWRGLANTLKDYRRFPAYSTPEALANLAGLQVPMMMVAALAGSEAGFLLLAQQVMAAPLALLGSSVSQVYVSRAPEEMRKGNLGDFTLIILIRLIQIGVGPIIFFGVIAPILFPFIFGAEWTRSGEIIAWMIPWTILQLLASPLSMVLHVTGRQSWAALLQITGAFLRIGAVLTVPIFLNDAYVESVIWGASLFYFVYLCVVIKTSGVFRVNRWFYKIFFSLIYVIPWVFISITVLYYWKNFT